MVNLMSCSALQVMRMADEKQYKETVKLCKITFGDGEEGRGGGGGGERRELVSIARVSISLK